MIMNTWETYLQFLLKIIDGVKSFGNESLLVSLLFEDDGVKDMEKHESIQSLWVGVLE